MSVSPAENFLKPPPVPEIPTVILTSGLLVLNFFAIASLMQVYFETIEGQVPNPEWDNRLAEASSKFRELRDKALGSFGGGSRWDTPRAA